MILDIYGVGAVHVLSDHINYYNVSEPVKVPKRKNRRIRKKALKRWGYKTARKALCPEGKIMCFAGVYVCSEVTFENLKELAKWKEENAS